MARAVQRNAARCFRNAVEATYVELARVPEMGTPGKVRQGKHAGVRLWPVTGFKNHLIAYRPHNVGIAVERLIHAKQAQSASPDWVEQSLSEISLGRHPDSDHLFDQSAGMRHQAVYPRTKVRTRPRRVLSISPAHREYMDRLAAVTEHCTAESSQSGAKLVVRHRPVRPQISIAGFVMSQVHLETAQQHGELLRNHLRAFARSSVWYRR